MLRNTIDRIRLLFRKNTESYLRFHYILGFYPRNIELYQQALLHKSTSVRSDKGRPVNNERLEFLGDAILDAVVGDIVYRHFEGKREGFLTNTRSKIVQRDTLNKLAVQIGLDKLIKYSTRSSSHNSYMYGNAFEAFIGAIYLDQGYDKCKEFIETRIIGRYIDLDKLSKKEVNFKSKLIEWCQKNKVEVSFELIQQKLDNNCNPVFQTEVLIENISAGHGEGYSKKESQQNAAQMALRKIKSSQDFVVSIHTAKEENLLPGELDIIGDEVIDYSDIDLPEENIFPEIDLEKDYESEERNQTECSEAVMDNQEDEIIVPDKVYEEELTDNQTEDYIEVEDDDIIVPENETEFSQDIAVIDQANLCKPEENEEDLNKERPEEINGPK